MFKFSLEGRLADLNGEEVHDLLVKEIWTKSEKLLEEYVAGLDEDDWVVFVQKNSFQVLLDQVFDLSYLCADH